MKEGKKRGGEETFESVERGVETSFSRVIEDDGLGECFCVGLCALALCKYIDRARTAWCARLLPPDIALVLLFLRRPLSSGLLLALLLQYYKVNTVLQQPTHVPV